MILVGKKFGLCITFECCTQNARNRTTDMPTCVCTAAVDTQLMVARVKHDIMIWINRNHKGHDLGQSRVLGRACASGASRLQERTRRIARPAAVCSKKCVT